MTDYPIVAIMYDFDRTLCTKDMQDYSFIPSLGMTEEEFWRYSNQLGKQQHMDSILAYMFAMVKISHDKNIPLQRKTLVDMGKNVELFSGVYEWFDRITQFGKKYNVLVEHYVISSGMKEIIEGTSISKFFKSIFACEFLYDENGNGIWPKTDVNYTNKTQFVYRINKGVLDISNNVDVNASRPDDDRRVYFNNMIYIGDGLTDVPCMKLVKQSGGHSIALYQNGQKDKVQPLLIHERVDWIFEADYRKGQALDQAMHDLICKLGVDNKLIRLNKSQLKEIQ